MNIEIDDQIFSQIICFILGVYMVAINLGTAGVMAYDKYISQQKVEITIIQSSSSKLQARTAAATRRIPEEFMLRLIRLGGLFGAKCAMNILNHKTKKQSFLVNSDSLQIRLANFSLISLFYIARFVN